MQTDLPGKVLLTESVNQWKIFDTYKRYEELRERREMEDDKEVEENETADEDALVGDIKPLR